MSNEPITECKVCGAHYWSRNVHCCQSDPLAISKEVTTSADDTDDENFVSDEDALAHAGRTNRQLTESWVRLKEERDAYREALADFQLYREYICERKCEL